MAANGRRERPLYLFLRSLLLALLLQTVARAAQPAEDPWSRRVRSVAREANHQTPDPDARRPSGAVTTVGSARTTAEASRRTRRGCRGGHRRRGRRGGANWRRHSDVRSDDIIIGHLSMQSYKPKLPEVRCELQPLYGFDVLAMCETWLTTNVPDRLISVNGYHLFRHDRPVSMSLP